MLLCLWFIFLWMSCGFSCIDASFIWLAGLLLLGVAGLFISLGVASLGCWVVHVVGLLVCSCHLVGGLFMLLGFSCRWVVGFFMWLGCGLSCRCC